VFTARYELGLKKIILCFVFKELMHGHRTHNKQSLSVPMSTYNSLNPTERYTSDAIDGASSSPDYLLSRHISCAFP